MIIIDRVYRIIKKLSTIPKFDFLRPPRSPEKQQLDSLTDLFNEALRTDSTSDVTSYDNSTDSLDVSFRPTYISSTDKRRSASDSGIESVMSENCGHRSSKGMWCYHVVFLSMNENRC